MGQAGGVIRTLEGHDPPPSKVVIDRTLGQQIVRQHVPLAATAV